MPTLLMSYRAPDNLLSKYRIEGMQLWNKHYLICHKKEFNLNLALHINFCYTLWPSQTKWAKFVLLLCCFSFVCLFFFVYLFCFVFCSFLFFFFFFFPVSFCRIMARKCVAISRDQSEVGSIDCKIQPEKLMHFFCFLMF